MILTEHKKHIEELFQITSSQQEILKISAIVLMFLDHLAIIYDRYSFLNDGIGRLVLPAFAYMLVYNYVHRTKSKAKYLLNLLLLAIVSQPIYTYAFQRDEYILNILFTLFIGLFLIFIYENKVQAKRFFKSRIKLEAFYAVVFFVLVLSLMLLANSLSYSFYGLLIIIMFYAVIKQPNYLTLSGLVISLFLLNLCSMNIMSINYTMLFILFLFLIKKASFEIGRLSGKWFYLFYPAHLFILRALS